MSLAKSLSTISYIPQVKLNEEEALLVYEKLKYDALDGNIEKVKFTLEKFTFNAIFMPKGHLEGDKFLEKTLNLFNLVDKPIIQLFMDELVCSTTVLNNLLFAYINHQKTTLEDLIFSKDNPQILVSFLNAVENYSPAVNNVKKEAQNYFNKLTSPTFILDRIIDYVCPEIFNVVSQSQEFIDNLTNTSLESLLNKQTHLYLSDEAKLSSFFDKEKTKLAIIEKLLTISPEINHYINVGIVDTMNKLLQKNSLSHIKHHYGYAQQYFHPLLIHGALSLDQPLKLQRGQEEKTFKELFNLSQTEISEIEKAILEKNVVSPNSYKKLKI